MICINYLYYHETICKTIDNQLIAIEVISFRQSNRYIDIVSTIPFISSLHPPFVDVGLATFFVHLSCLCCLSISQV